MRLSICVGALIGGTSLIAGEMMKGEEAFNLDVQMAKRAMCEHRADGSCYNGNAPSFSRNQILKQVRYRMEISEVLKQTSLPSPFVLSADVVKQITEISGIEVDALLQLLVPVAAVHAIPPISNYLVGAAALGESGAIYLGVNLEFLGIPLNECVHGEQFAFINARKHGERSIVAIALSAAPCGHCRQFMNEMGSSADLQIFTPHADPITLSALLPASFGPQDLGLSGNLLAIPEHDGLFLYPESSLAARAFEAARASYAPYSDSPSGVALRTREGNVYSGSYLENAAFNPSVSPLQSALVSLVAELSRYDAIAEAILVERQGAKVSQEAMTREILKNIAPDAAFSVRRF
ncbi:MAG: cytidine deaminase [Chlamydiota bacterium]